MKLVFLSVALLGLSACAGSYRDGSRETTDYFGRANTANIATQADAARHDESTTSGERMADAVAKYKNGDPAPIRAPAASQVAGSTQGN